MKRKRKESCPSPILDDSPKRTKVQAQRKFAQNSGVHSPIITPIRDLETADLPHTSVLPEPVELLPMKRPNTEDFLTFLCFRGTPILPPNLQFFNTASIVADGQVHEIKGESPKNGPIDIAKCAGSSSEKPFIAFGVRKRADPIVISKQMERKRRHALALQALRRKYQEQKMAKIRALTISKLSEKTTNKTLVKTNTIQKTETVTKKSNSTLQKTKVIATKHVKVTTQTLKTKVKPKMCLRSFRGKFVQKELPFRPKRPLPEKDIIRKRPKVKNIVRTSRNSNKADEVKAANTSGPQSHQKTIKKLATIKKPLKIPNKSQVTRLEPVIRSSTTAGTKITRPQMKRRFILAPSIVSANVKPKLRSTTMKKTVISRRKAQQRLRAKINRTNRPDRSLEESNNKETLSKQSNDSEKKESSKKSPQEKSSSKKLANEENARKPAAQDSQKPTQGPKRLTRRDSELSTKNMQDKQAEKSDTKKEITKNIEVKKEVKIAETGSKKMVKKNVNLKREFNLKSNTKDVKKNIALQKTSDTVLEKNELGQKITRGFKSVEMTVKKVITRKSEETKQTEKPDKNSKDKKSNPKSSNAKETILKDPVEVTKKSLKSSSKPREEMPKKTDKSSGNPKKNLKPPTTKTAVDNDSEAAATAALSGPSKNLRQTSNRDSPKLEPAKAVQDQPKKKATAAKNISEEKILQKQSEEDGLKRVTPKRTSKEVGAAIKFPKEDHISKNPSENPKKECPPVNQDVPNKNKEVTAIQLKESEVIKNENPTRKKNNAESMKQVQNEGTPVIKDAPNIVDKKGKKVISNPKLPVLEDKSEKEKSFKGSKKEQKEEISKTVQKEDTIKDLKNDSSSKPEPPDDIAKKSHNLEESLTKILPEISGDKKLSKKEQKEESASESTLQQETTILETEKDRSDLKKNSEKETAPTKKVPKHEISSKKSSKDTTLTKKDDNPRRKPPTRREGPDQMAPVASTRPSRKTKEAAAIYMEILSHKLVNESTIDDDNVSIDSFPELPNVKKTEQREIELKAQAKTSKEEGKTGKNSPMKSEENCDKDQAKQSDVPKTKEIQKKSEDTETPNISDRLLLSPSVDSTPKTKLPLPSQKKKSASPGNESNPKDETNPSTTKTSLGKRKLNPLTVASDDDSDNEVLQAKIRKCEAKKNLLLEPLKNPQLGEEPPEIRPSDEGTTTRRQTRRCNQINKESYSDSSDESFHIDIRVPRKKKITRSRNRAPVVPPVSVLEKNVDIILEAARVLEGEKALPMEIVQADQLPAPISEETAPNPNPKEFIKPHKDTKKVDTKPTNDSDSDQSTTSDINLKSLQAKQRNKKLSKTKSTKSSAKSAASFSDSDEEPLVKLTSKSIKSATDVEETKKKPEKHKPPLRKTADKSMVEASIVESKPKRECTKRPSNYLPMLSSSDEDDEPYFHGFNTSKEDLNKPKVFVQSLAPSLDLLSKDIGRKGKVNMSNEQIEQWLKDSALASSSVAKENDAMLKFGEKIPADLPKTEVVLPPIISDLKPSDSEELKLKIVEPEPSCSSKTALTEDKPKVEPKSVLPDRKWIFKKDKKELMPNKDAFSPENECSVYAFGEDNEDIVSTPFRRPSRRPSSTATSRSEDELSKNDESSKQGQFRKPNPSDSEDSRFFNIPQNPTKIPKTTKLEPMVPPSNYHSKRQAKPNLDRFPEPFDDYKYKIPSSPSASSGSSAKLYKKGTQKQKGKAWESINPVYVSDFPKPTDPAKLVEAPVFHPTDQEFQDPLEYIERIRHKAEQFGICKIVPPNSFKPECKVSDDMRFTAYNQYVHKMLHRWGPNFKEFIAIRKYLATQSIFLKTPPLIGGMEIDLPRLYQTVQSLGGLKEVIEKKKWSKVSDQMKIPKSAQDRVTKLDDIYCKYLLPYDTLSPAEREKLFDEVETYWAKRESKNLQDKIDLKQQGGKPDESSEQDFYDSDDNEAEECTIKGKNMALNAFYRIARNTMSMYFKVAEPSASEVEQEFWRYVTQKQNHICVHSASIDCGTWGYGFAVSKNSPFAKHAWNLKVLSNNNGSVLRSLGPVMGVTIPTLHVGMVFSACCWYRDPHGLPWVEYLHTGGNKIWYGIPSSSCEVFHAAMQKLVPNYCRDKELWLPSDTAMIPPGMLMDHNVSLCRTIQEPGQFIVVFPKVFTSSICTGYVVSESVYFAPLYWLKTARNLFNDLKTSCEPSMFSLDKLLISISNDNRSSAEVLRVIIPFIEELCANEKENRLKLKSFGKVDEEKVTTTELPTKKKKIQSVDGDFECEICRMNLFVSMVIDTQDDLIYCLEDAIKLVTKNSKIIERLKLRYSLEVDDLENIPKKINSMIETKLQKKVPNKYSGMPTLLK